MRGLDGKVAVVAGGCGRIGTAVSTRLAEEGMAVVVGDLDRVAAEAVAEELTASGATAVAAQFDITDEQSVAALVATAVREFGQLDGVHANVADLSANTIGRDKDAVDLPTDVFDRTIAVNLRGHLLCTRYAVPHLLKQGGAMVYTSSGAAFLGEAGWPAYAMSKSGLGGLVRHVATRWGREGVRGNAVAPGMVVTDGAPVIESERARTVAATPSPRLGKPEDVAAAVAFLLSTDAEWINGQVLSVDGGQTMR